jgi:hypothetical protein
MEDTRKPEEPPPGEPESFEVTELEDKELEGAAGGDIVGTGVLGDVEKVPTNTNCGCNGRRFDGIQGASNQNCGC